MNINNGINVLSLFDGMSCGQIALERAGIKVNNYFASEIDKHAIAVTMKNYPNTIQLGSVVDVRGADLPKIDLLIGGSPCQGFSFAGKRLNFDDPRSKLFFEFVRLKNELSPKWFLLENVRMNKEHQAVISEYMSCEPVVINSNLVSAQNRERLYWTNIHFQQPDDLGIVIRDILEPEIPFNLVSDVVPLDSHSSKKGLICVAGIGKNKRWATGQTNLQRNFSQGERIYSAEGKSCTLSASTGGSAGAGNCLITKASQGSFSQSNRIYDVTGKHPTLMSNNAGGPKQAHIAEDVKLGYRKLTITEAERLQTLPDGYTASIPISHRFKSIGNGWTVDVIAHICNGLK